MGTMLVDQLNTSYKHILSDGDIAFHVVSENA